MIPIRMRMRALVLAGLLASIATAAAWAQAAPKVAVIDVNRIMTDSARGKDVLGELEKFQAERADSLKAMNDSLSDLQKRYQEGRLSLAEDKLAELEAQIDEKTRDLQRAQEDAQRALQKRRGEDIKKIEQEVFPIINAVGREFGYTLIFNKFQSGLVYATDEVDITDLIIQRLDATANGG